MTQRKKEKIENKFKELIIRINNLHDAAYELVDSWAINHYYVVDLKRHCIQPDTEQLSVDKIYTHGLGKIKAEMDDLLEAARINLKKYNFLNSKGLKNYGDIADLYNQKRKEYEASEWKTKVEQEIKKAIEKRRGIRY